MKKQKKNGSSRKTISLKKVFSRKNNHQGLGEDLTTDEARELQKKMAPKEEL
ncbi:MAG: hypothetical protein HOP08_20485 [Cyclobacteriaceae bacterium]|nr:hypothetical protein [Cyclobacteriaceae bacterium]